MPSINVNGINIYYELHGQGKPLVLIAGYACDHTFWNAMLDELARSFLVLVFDNRAIGRTKDDGTLFTLEDLAKDTIVLTQQLGILKPHIIGQSMGGAIAQIIAKIYPDEISKLIILNSTPKFNTRTVKAIDCLLNLRKENISLDLLIELSMPWFFSSDYLANPKNIASFKEMITNNPYPQSVEDQARQYKNIPTFDSRDWLNEIKATALVIAAEEDIIALPSESEKLANDIPNAQFIIIPGGHSSPLEQPKELNRAILNFFGSE